MYTIATFAFSIPKPRLTSSGFKQIKPRLLRQGNTARLKRPGVPPQRPGVPRPGLSKKPTIPRPTPTAPKPY